MFRLLGRRQPLFFLRNKTSPSSLVHLPRRHYIRPYYDRSSVQKHQSSLPEVLGRKVNAMDPNKVLWGVIGTNVAIYGVWQYGISNYRQFGDPGCLQFMLRHFMNSPEAWQNGRWHTLLTSAFSHKDLDHLGINMLVLYSMGQGVLQAIGNSRFLLLYAGAGVAGSLATIFYRKYIRPSLERSRGRHALDNPTMGSLGASGSVMGLTTFFACAFPRATFLVFFVIPMPAIGVVGLFAAYDIYKATTLNTGLVDSAAHVGGIAYGAAYYFMRIRPLLRKGRWRM